MTGTGKGLVTLAVGIILVLALIIAPVAADTMTREEATNRDGNDYTSLFPDTPGYAGTAESCSQNCLNQSSCNAATFVEVDHSCWLKQIVPPATEMSGATSFVRQKTSPTSSLPATSAATAIPATPASPGFECVFAILGFLIVLMVRKSIR